MAQPTTTFLDELMAAARGCVALLVGNRQAPSYFDFSQRGLVGSLIALVIGLAVQAFGPQLLGVTEGSAGGSAVVILGGIMLAVEIGVAYAVLRILSRGEELVPFIVVQNWTVMIQGVIAVIITAVFGPPFAVDPATKMAEFTNGTLPYLVLGIAALIVWVNSARLILTLRPKHVALFVAAQLTAALLIPPMLGVMV